MDRQIRKAAILLLGIWLIIISWITLFNLNYAIAVRIVNGIPFLWIAELFQIFQSGRAVLFYVRLVMKGLLINLWMFAPAGFLMPLAFPVFRNGKRIIAAGILCSIFIEILQFMHGGRVVDIDDVLMNGLGTGLGFCIYQIGLFLIRTATIGESINSKKRRLAAD